MECGVAQRLDRKNFYKYTQFPKPEPDFISLLEILPILTIWILGIFVSLFILLMEIIFHKYSQCILRKKKNKVLFHYSNKNNKTKAK